MDSRHSKLKDWYYSEVRPKLKDTLELSNIMQVPKVCKIVLNVGIKRSSGDSKTFQTVEKMLSLIAGQAAIRRSARKSIAGFKIREGMPVGVCVTLRGAKAYNFMDKLIKLGLPKVRDFQGVSKKLDGKGNYNLGIQKCDIFPDIDDSFTEASNFGLNITFHTSAYDDYYGYELLKAMGMPFKKR